MGKEGEKWKISKERREKERMRELERSERLEKAAAKKRTALHQGKCKDMQRKITEELSKLPQNRKVLVEREMERERLILMKEAKQELWRKWRQNKGKTINPRQTTKSERDKREDELDHKLKRIGEEVRKYEEELEIVRKEARTKVERLEKKKRKENTGKCLNGLQAS